MTESFDVRTAVREKYGAAARGEGGCCDQGSGCGCGCVDDTLHSIGYSDDDIAAIPEGANLGLGCGNPLASAELKPGETVLDLGSGAGIDCFLAARAVGAEGRVIGVDMTPAMIERARANAERAGLSQVEFRLGEIEHLPVADATVDLVISNCVVNLSPDKPQVFQEVWRALKPGGRLLISDLVLTRPLPPEMKEDVDLHVGCVAGASRREEYLEMLQEAGFSDVEVVQERRYEPGVANLPDDGPLRSAFEAVVSVQVRAFKGSGTTRAGA